LNSEEGEGEDGSEGGGFGVEEWDEDFKCKAEDGYGGGCL
jgi:hypothetical protein